MAAKFLNVILLLCVAQQVRTELFTALVDLKKVLVAERDIAQDIRHYIQQEEQRLHELRGWVLLLVHVLNLDCKSKIWTEVQDVTFPYTGDMYTYWTTLISRSLLIYSTFFSIDFVKGDCFKLNFNPFQVFPS